LQPLFYQLTLDSATEFLLGESVDVLRSPAGSEQQLFGEAFDFAQTELNLRLRLGPFVWLYRNKKFDRACVRVHNFIDKFVAKALEYRRENQASGKTTGEKQKGKYIFMNELSMATDDPIQIRSELLNILLAGRDTTAGLLSNTFHVLARRPDIWARLRSEVDELGGKRPDYETLRGMKYLKNVLNECRCPTGNGVQSQAELANETFLAALRLYPSVPQNIRFANRDTTLPVGGGPDGKSPVFVAKGQMVAYGVFAMHRRKDLYGEDADEYKPERWESLRVGWGYLPFNGGPRICVGQQFALTEAGYTLVRMVQEFEKIETNDPRPWLESLHLTLGSGTGVQASLYPRT
jgi:cytochrome P450